MVIEYLRRYTQLPALIYLLKERRLTLLDPQSWDDRNDSHYLELYRQRKHLTSVLALCFTETGEAYHHWRVFANGSSGVCIGFKRSALIKAAKIQRDLRCGAVDYLTLPQLRRRKLRVDELPFLKRSVFKHESEWRMVYGSTTQQIAHLDIRIPLSCIERVTLSPWMSTSLVPHVKATIQTIKGCEALKICRSTLISNEEWKTLGGAAIKEG